MATYKIAIDTLGSDKGPEMIVEGALMALAENPELSIVLFGDEQVIGAELAKAEYDHDRIEIVHAPDAITNYDNPMEAIFKKTESSLVKALQALAARDDILGLINAGSTGALIAGALRYVPAKPLRRPALAAILPAAKGGFTCLVDTGANIDCTASMLVDFAHMGADLMKQCYAIENPRIGLLSNGAEETKGNKLVKETHPILAADESLNFIGNVEGNVALSGVCDVLVCDGFAGNQVLKVTEGTATRLITDIMKYAYRENADEVKKLGAHLMGVYDIGSLGGGVILGVAKPIIKTRGNAKASAIVNTSEMLLNMASHKSVFDKSRNKI